MSDFYITLLSNSSMDIYPDNRTSSFTVHIPRNLSLVGDWDVAAAEIHYPYVFFTVQKDENKIQLQTLDITKKYIDSKGVDIQGAKWTELEITPGFYKDVNAIINALNETISKNVKKLVKFFQFDDKTNRVFINKTYKFVINDTMPLSFKMSSRLALQLGLRPNEEYPVDLQAPYPTNLNSGIPDIMFIYCDIIEPQIIGDSWSKVLRTLSNTPDGAVTHFSQACSVEFMRLQYVPVQKKHIQSIRIDIRDVTSNPFPFLYGTLSVKLHFKRRN